MFAVVAVVAPRDEANKQKGLLKNVRDVAARVTGAYAGSGAAARVAGGDIGAGLYAQGSYLPLRVTPNPPIKRNRRPTLDGRSVQYRVKPFPDPDRPAEETKWLTENEIGREALKPSTKWIEAGTGSVGRYYVEIIGCDGLPNMDFSITGRDKTDGTCTPSPQASPSLAAIWSLAPHDWFQRSAPSSTRTV